MTRFPTPPFVSEWTRFKEHYAGLEERKYLTLAKARDNALKIDFHSQPPACKPSFLGVKEIKEFPIEDLVPYFDWNPFFTTWQLRGKYPNRGYPKIFNDETVGAQAKELFDDANEMLKKFIAEKKIIANGKHTTDLETRNPCAMQSFLVFRSALTTLSCSR